MSAATAGPHGHRLAFISPFVAAERIPRLDGILSILPRGNVDAERAKAVGRAVHVGEVRAGRDVVEDECVEGGERRGVVRGEGREGGVGGGREGEGIGRGGEGEREGGGFRGGGEGEEEREEEREHGGGG